MKGIGSKAAILLIFLGLILYFNFPSFNRFFLPDDTKEIMAKKYDLAQQITTELSNLSLSLPEVDNKRIKLLLKDDSLALNLENPSLKRILGDYFSLETLEQGNYLVQKKFASDVFLSDFSKELNKLSENLGRIKKIELSSTEDSLIFYMEKDKRLALNSPPLDSIFEQDDFEWVYDVITETYRAYRADPPNLLNLGLDLVGGIYLDVGISQEKTIADFLKSRLDVLRTAMNDVGMEYTDATSDLKNSITIDTASADSFIEGLADSEGLTEGFSVDTEVDKVLLTLDNDFLQTLQQDSLARALDIIRGRIDLLGVKEPSVQKRGEDSIVVQVPGQVDPVRIKQLITQQANLEFRLLVDGATPESLNGGEILYYDDVDEITKEVISSNPIVVEKTIAMPGDMIDDARVVFDQFSGSPQVSMNLKPEGAELFGDLTAQNIGKSMAIILDGKIKSYPRINQAIYGGEASITGQFSIDESRDLAIVLRSGALPVYLEVNEERVIGASLGEDSVRASLYALLIGFAVLGVIMCVYYKLSGIFAIITLAINFLLVLAILSFFGATLTLPGIAGIILTIGMAVDANVLIYERIREELKQKASPRKAIQQSFSRVAVTIFDSNLTTLIVAAILFQFGTGPIRGFAITLAVGIFSTIINSLGTLRLLYEIAYISKNNITKISI